MGNFVNPVPQLKSMNSTLCHDVDCWQNRSANVLRESHLNIDWNNGRRSRADDLSTNSFRVKRFQSNHPLHVRNLIFKQVGRLYNALNDYPAIGMKKITEFMRLLQKRC